MADDTTGAWRMIGAVSRLVFCSGHRESNDLTSFSRTMRALDADGMSPALLAVILVAGLGGVWTSWLVARARSRLSAQRSGAARGRAHPSGRCAGRRAASSSTSLVLGRDVQAGRRAARGRSRTRVAGDRRGADAARRRRRRDRGACSARSRAEQGAIEDAPARARGRDRRSVAARWPAPKPRRTLARTSSRASTQLEKRGLVSAADSEKRPRRGAGAPGGAAPRRAPASSGCAPSRLPPSASGAAGLRRSLRERVGLEGLRAATASTRRAVARREAERRRIRAPVSGRLGEVDPGADRRRRSRRRSARVDRPAGPGARGRGVRARRRWAASGRGSRRGCASTDSRGRSTATSTRRSRASPARRAISASASSSRSSAAADSRIPLAARHARRRRGRGRARRAARPARCDRSATRCRATPPPHRPDRRQPSARCNDRPRCAATAAMFAPEVVQTSAMDCGPAALEVPARRLRHPGQLRRACRRPVRPISTAPRSTRSSRSPSTLGLDAEQIMVPADHLLLRSARALPALRGRAPRATLTHFLVVWRRHGPFVQVMDPAKGRRWLRRDALRDELYVHRAAVPAAAWREWAGVAGVSRRPERAAGRAAACPAEAASALLRAAIADRGWRALALARRRHANGRASSCARGGLRARPRSRARHRDDPRSARRRRRSSTRSCPATTGRCCRPDARRRRHGSCCAAPCCCASAGRRTRQPTPAATAAAADQRVAAALAARARRAAAAPAGGDAGGSSPQDGRSRPRSLAAGLAARGRRRAARGDAAARLCSRSATSSSLREHRLVDDRAAARVRRRLMLVLDVADRARRAAHRPPDRGAPAGGAARQAATHRRPLLPQPSGVRPGAPRAQPGRVCAASRTSARVSRARRCSWCSPPSRWPGSIRPARWRRARRGRARARRFRSPPSACSPSASCGSAATPRALTPPLSRQPARPRRRRACTAPSGRCASSTKRCSSSGADRACTCCAAASSIEGVQLLVGSLLAAWLVLGFVVARRAARAARCCSSTGR